jgi:hypothetical protein
MEVEGSHRSGHTNTVVLRMWNEYSATGSPSIMEMVCDTSTLAYLDTGIE